MSVPSLVHTPEPSHSRDSFLVPSCEHRLSEVGRVLPATSTLSMRWRYRPDSAADDWQVSGGSLIGLTRR